MSSHSLHEGIFPTQGWNPGLLPCRQILYHLIHQGRERRGYEIILPELDFHQGHQTPRAEPSPESHLLHRKARFLAKLMGMGCPASFLLLLGSCPSRLGPKNVFLGAGLSSNTSLAIKLSFRVVNSKKKDVWLSSKGLTSALFFACQGGATTEKMKSKEEKVKIITEVSGGLDAPDGHVSVCVHMCVTHVGERKVGQQQALTAHVLQVWGFHMAQRSRIHSQCSRHRRCGFGPWVRKIPWRRAWQPTPVFLPGEAHGQRSLAGCSPRSLRAGLD